jgi:hypothetical protein
MTSIVRILIGLRHLGQVSIPHPPCYRNPQSSRQWQKFEISNRARRAKVIDQHAAAFILQGALDRLARGAVE